MNKKKLLYILWAMFYCACFGCSFVKASGTGEKIFLTGLSVLFFLPPFWLCILAQKENHRKTLLVLRWISLGSLILTPILIILNFLSIYGSRFVGWLLYVLLTLVSVPLATSQTWALSLFFWAILFFLTLQRKRTDRR